MKARRPAIDDELLAAIAAGTEVAAGEEFFATLVKRVAESMGVLGAWVTEWIGESRRLRALSFWFDAGYYGDYEYDVAGTPCETVVVDKRLSHVPERLVELFPDDPSLADLGAVSYMGVPLLDVDGELLGHLAVLDGAPLPCDGRLEAILRIFAGRAAVELQRLRRDRALLERERKLTRLFDGVMDAIVELDRELRVTQLNGAASRLWGDALRGAAFVDRLGHESAERLRSWIARLDAPEARPSQVWIANGLDCIDGDGRAFPAEASLSRFESDGERFYSLVLRNTLERDEARARVRELSEETDELRHQLEELRGSSQIIGASPAVLRVLFDVRQVAPTDATVLVTGETGSGKELVANAVHRESPRAEARFVKLNCAAIPSNLQESELFGHERGAFTGATQRRDGRFKLADGGTLFLDEVGELPLDLQAKLLRVLQEGEFEPVGGSRTQKVDVRIVAATNRDLRKLVDSGTFREDLYYRLNVFPIHLPPLRERGEDVLEIAEAFVLQLGRDRGRPHVRLTPDARARLMRYDWPGNVRELRNVIERALITSVDGRTLNLERALPDEAPRPVAASAPTDDRIRTAIELEDLERLNMRRALEAAGWKIAGAGGAAERLGLRPNTLASRMKSLGIQRPTRN
ncbi:MAG: sigma 54-interacting transcriptional regulator [Planctomycetota bacterium]